MITEKREKIEFSDPDLTRIDKDTRFVIDKFSGKVIAIWKNQSCNSVINYLIKKKKILSSGDLRFNRYGDILIIKKF